MLKRAVFLDAGPLRAEAPAPMYAVQSKSNVCVANTMRTWS